MNIFGNFIPERFLEKFPKDHLIIKAAKGQADVPDNIRNAMFQFCRPKDNKRIQIDALAFCASLCARTKTMIKYFGEEKMEKFFLNQLSAGKENYDESKLLQALSEVECICYALCTLPGDKIAVYEPITNGKKNPEARIISTNEMAYSYDIEVKTPRFPERKDYIENKKKFFRVNIPINKNDLEKLREIVEGKGYIFMLPSIGKLKDYINSAGEKFLFSQATNQSNILFINWTFDDIYESNLMQPIACLCNEKTGLLKTTKFHADFGIDINALKKISAIVIYKDIVDSFVSLNMLDAIHSGNCKLILNDKFCENFDRNKILAELNIPEANLKQDGALFQMFGNYNLDEEEEITEIVTKIIEKQ